MNSTRSGGQPKTFAGSGPMAPFDGGGARGSRASARGEALALSASALMADRVVPGPMTLPVVIRHGLAVRLHFRDRRAAECGIKHAHRAVATRDDDLAVYAGASTRLTAGN